MTNKKTEKVDLQDQIRMLMNPDAAKELADLSPTFQQFLIRWTDLRDNAMMEDVKEFIEKVITEDKCAIVETVTTAVGKQVAEAMGQVYKKLESLEEGQSEIKIQLSNLKTDVKEVRDRVFVEDDAKFKALGAFADRKNYLKRYATIIFISVLLSVIAGAFIFNNNKRIRIIENLLQEHIRTEQRK